MGLSMYHSATGNQSPHCIHAIGIGKTGAYMVEALLRTGEIEDMLEDPRARFTGLAIDIGDSIPAPPKVEESSIDLEKVYCRLPEKLLRKRRFTRSIAECRMELPSEESKVKPVALPMASRCSAVRGEPGAARLGRL